MGVFISKTFPLQYYDTTNIGIRWLNVLKKYEKLILADYYRTVETWENHHPVFDSKISYAGGEPALLVFTQDPIYRDIDEGTSIRYDVMTEDFVPKTKARVLRSFKGQGGYAYTDHKNPRPGIEPRYFSDTITRKYEDKIVVELRRALRQGVETGRNKL